MHGNRHVSRDPDEQLINSDDLHIGNHESRRIRQGRPCKDAKSSLPKLILTIVGRFAFLEKPNGMHEFTANISI